MRGFCTKCRLFVGVCYGVIFLLSSLRSSNAYVTGTGSCVGGKPALADSQHANPFLHQTILSGALNDAGIIVVIEESEGSNKTSGTTTKELKNGTAIVLETQKDYVVAVIGMVYQYKGCFIRLEALGNQSSEDVNSSLLPNLNTHSADYVCSGSEYNGKVVGITHFNGSIFKSRHDGILRMNEPGKVKLDVTTVGESTSIRSLYAYSNYSLEFVNSESMNSAIDPTNSTNQGTNGNTTKDQAHNTSDSNGSGIESNTSVTAPSPTPSNVKNNTSPTNTIRGNSSNGAPDNVDDKYTQLISEIINGIQITFKNVTSLSQSTLQKLVDVQTKWFLDFYNNRSSQEDQSNKSSTATRLLTGTHRSISETEVPPQLFVVKGSMNTTISISDQQPVHPDMSESNESAIHIIYSQVVSYRLYLSDSPSIPSNMKGQNYNPLSTVEYIALPFRSVSGNQEFATLLKQNLPKSFQGIETPIDFPIILGDEYNNSTDNTTSGDATGAENNDNNRVLTGLYIAAIILGAIIVLIIIVGITMKILVPKCKEKKTAETTFDDDDRQTEGDDNEEQQEFRTKVRHLSDPSSYDGASQFTSGLSGVNTSMAEEKPEEEKSEDVIPTTKNQKNKKGEAASSVSSLTGVTAVSNQEKNTVSIKPVEEYVVYAPAGKLGIVVDNPEDNSGPVIYAIRETSPLRESKLRKGDRLIMIDELDVTNMTPSEISQIIGKRSKNLVRKLTLQRVASVIPV